MTGPAPRRQRKPLDFAHSVVVGLLFTPMRVLAGLLCIILCRVLVGVAVLGLSADELRAKPLTGLRRRIVSGALTTCSRSLIFCFGFWYIETHGTRLPPSAAPVLVANHITLIEGVALVTAKICATCVTRNVRARARGPAPPAALPARARGMA